MQYESAYFGFRGTEFGECLVYGGELRVLLGYVFVHGGKESFFALVVHHAEHSYCLLFAGIFCLSQFQQCACLLFAEPEELCEAFLSFSQFFVLGLQPFYVVEKFCAEYGNQYKYYGKQWQLVLDVYVLGYERTDKVCMDTDNVLYRKIIT